jgi:ABC-type nitrate/sulfonate/bicarbonate transport system substrate-binding protein
VKEVQTAARVLGLTVRSWEARAADGFEAVFAALSKKVRVAIPGYTIAVLSFLAAKTSGYYTAEGLDVELFAMRAPTANVAVLSGSVEFSGVPLSG